jgi:hypothetical protein
MKLRHSYMPIVLSVIVLSPATAAPAHVCPSSTITMQATACSSSRPVTSLGPAITVTQNIPAEQQRQGCTHTCAQNDANCQAPVILGDPLSTMCANLT